MNTRKKFVESFFGITLPTSEMYISAIASKNDPRVEAGITYAPDWKCEGDTILPPELEVYLPKEGMTPEQAIEQVDICINLGKGHTNDSHMFYSKETMVRFIDVAVTNCICIASKDFSSWMKHAENGKDYISKLSTEIEYFDLHFNADRPMAYYSGQEVRLRFIGLLLENDYPLDKGVDDGLGNIRSNTLFRNIFSAHTKSNIHSNIYIQNFVSQLLGKTCYDVTQQLERIK